MSKPSDAHVTRPMPLQSSSSPPPLPDPFTRVVRAADTLASALVNRVARTILDRVDVTAYVLERVDLDRIVSAVDVDKVAARLDVEAVIGRVDLVGIARTVIDAIDLPGIIYDSTNTMASEGVAGIRIQGHNADEKLNRLVNRMLLRRSDGDVAVSPVSVVDDAG
jgi:hypothetical protein